MTPAITKIVAIVIILIIVAVGSVAAFQYLRTQGGPTVSVCTTCFVTEPVVDVIIPSLISHSGASGQSNAPLNVTRGEIVPIVVQIYSTRQINAKMLFHILSSPSQNGSNLDASSLITGSFNPATLLSTAQSSGNTSLSLAVSNGALFGEYTAAVSATDIDNSSWTWGTIITINVS
ncbi:MAG: hypothetical protein ACYC7D_11910 [Nitrososphaerales archaeon]